MRLHTLIYNIALLLCVWFLAFACTKNDEEAVPTSPPADSGETTEPTADEVEEIYDGEVAILSEDDAVVPYLRKRFPNITSQIGEQTRVTFMGEAKAATLLADETQYKEVERFWRKNNAVAFVKPGRNALKLFLKLNDKSEAEADALDSDALASYKDLVLYIVKADGFAMMYFDPRNGTTSKLRVREKSDGQSESEQSGDVVESITLSDYRMGRIAESTAEWLKKNVKPGEQLLDIALCSESENSYYSQNMVTLTSHMQIRVDHNMAYELWDTADHDVKAIGNRYTDAKFQIDVVAGFSESLGSDVYDISIHEEFDASKSYVGNTVVWEHLAYAHKYSGGYYDCCDVSMTLKNPDADFDFVNNSDIHDPVPTPVDKGYSTTHDPGSTTLGGSITGGGSVGASGVSGSASGTFSCSFTLPRNTVTTPEDAMPLSYEGKHNNVHWKYDADITLYEVHNTLNPYFNEPNSILYNNYVTNQCLTFEVKHTKELNLGATPVYLDTNLCFTTYHECAADDNERNREWQSHKFRMSSYMLPSVSRYFEDYTPKAHSSGPVDAAGGWAQLESTMMTNNNYYALAGNYLFRSPTEEGLLKVAERYWDETLDIFTNGNYTDKTLYDYVITLQNSKGDRLKRGLYIHDGIWEQVDDVEPYIEALGK
ncbi:MAG: hypothetical protein IKA70_05490 [Alistipes sp.]|nr:hypothetical protein [Alistipes sp.]